MAATAADSRRDTGTVPLNDADLRMCWIIAGALGARDADKIKELVQALQKDATLDWGHIGASSATLRTALTELLTRIEANPATLIPSAVTRCHPASRHRRGIQGLLGG